ncbi:hypothetical protein M472_04995 [Sphingobacterium paucimobilis HER1398]|uniref:Uncharacterized protein n=1 Tax=Sphingobacterium paucimobilis HER1398 TaxID=1346330 RepID=U2H8S7_9SPHI|nr:hypothetical protein M472_04995 [Sphingobacterium paucimobilis HER1398]
MYTYLYAFSTIEVQSGVKKQISTRAFFSIQPILINSMNEKMPSGFINDQEVSKILKI